MQVQVRIHVHTHILLFPLCRVTLPNTFFGVPKEVGNGTSICTLTHIPHTLHLIWCSTPPFTLHMCHHTLPSQGILTCSPQCRAQSVPSADLSPLAAPVAHSHVVITHEDSYTDQPGR